MSKPSFAWSLALALPLCLFALPAWAGSCPPCTTKADCGGSFCVNWVTSPGCGEVTQICCPGQGCNVEDGCPSCFTAGTCSIVDGPSTCVPSATSASSAVSGATSATGATSTTGATSATGATSVTGAGTSTGSSTASTNPGSGGEGIGGSTAGDTDSGCSCAFSPADAKAPFSASLVALFALLGRRRRNRRSV